MTAARTDQDDAPAVVLPPIGLGTMRQQGAQCVRVVEAALAEGYRHLDTARKYGNETEVGAGLARSSIPRDRVTVTTKLAPDELAPDRVRPAVEDSLRQLGLQDVDLLLAHWPNPEVSIETTLAAMVELRDAGLVRAVGVANHTVELFIRAAAVTDLLTNQVEYHPYLRQDAVLAATRSAGAVLTAYCPLARAGELLVDPVLQAIAEDHRATPARVVLSWLVHQPDVVAIPGASTVEHLRENLAAVNLKLEATALDAIGRLDRGQRVVDPPHAPVWD